MFCSRGFNLTSWILDFVPALVTHAKCESSWRLHYGILSRSKSLSRRERDSLQPLPTIPGRDPSTYVFTKTDLQRNLFRIPLH